MKKFAALLVLALLLLTTAAVSADTPSGVGPAVRVDGLFCWVDYFDDGMVVASYEGTATLQYSNGVPGHTTWQCDAELVSGTPMHDVWRGDVMGCDALIVAAGNNLRWSAQCVGMWNP